MEHEGEDGDPLELFGDNNLESDLRVKQERGAGAGGGHGLPGGRGEGPKGAGGEPRLGGQPVISERELREHFGVPLSEVAAKFGLCVTALKKLCRRYGVRKWPHRRLQSVERRLQTIKEELRAANPAAQGSLREEAAQLRLERERIYEGKAQDLLEGDGSLETLGDEDVTDPPRHPPAAAPLPPPASSARRVKQEEGARGSKGKVAIRGGVELLRGGVEQGGEPLGILPLEDSRDHGGMSWLEDEGGSSSAPPGATLHAAQDPGIVAPEHHDGHGGGPESLSQLERLEEENSSLRAISKYLMQERKELARKAELSAKRNHNLYCLSRVLKLRLGVLNEHEGGAVDPGSLAVLDDVTGEAAGGGLLAGPTPLEFNADGLLSESHHELRPERGKLEAHGEGLHGEGKSPPFHQELCWFAPGHGGEHGDDLLNDLI